MKNSKKKSLLSKKTSLSKGIEDNLNEQIAMESKASQQYLACASWCHKEGYEGAASFLYMHTDEERMHMMKLIRYVNDSGGHAIGPDIAGVRNSFESLKEMFEFILEQEIKVTKSINEIVDNCFKEKDYATFQFMQWFVTEQREEEQLCRRILELFELIGEEGQGLWLIDQELAKLKAAEAAGGAEAEAEGEA
jgi:ferritin